MNAKIMLDGGERDPYSHQIQRFLDFLYARFEQTAEIETTVRQLKQLSSPPYSTWRLPHSELMPVFESLISLCEQQNIPLRDTKILNEMLHRINSLASRKTKLILLCQITTEFAYLDAVLEDKHWLIGLTSARDNLFLASNTDEILLVDDFLNKLEGLKNARKERGYPEWVTLEKFIGKIQKQILQRVTK